jgi:glycosyltransferase involved in cell wall biosynthesis
MRWIVSQVGARQHYATPRAFALRNELRTFYTDAWSGPARGVLLHMPGRLKALADRYSPDLPADRVVASNFTTLWEQATFKFRVPQRTPLATHNEWIREGKRFATWVNHRLSRKPADPSKDAFYGCKSVCLETLQMLKKQGVFTLIDQADPARVEEQLVQQERDKWPGWEPHPGAVPQSYYDRCAAEWATADVVLVYSAWTKDAIVRQGVPAEKVIVVPLAYEHPPATQAIPPQPLARGQRMTVLWLGTVNLRKGIQYLLEAAKKLIDRPIDFVVAGEILISQEAVASAPPNVKFTGRILRGRAASMYRSAHLFVLPTISDSFAITQVEAMSYGLPVIATPRCGRVVTDGLDGRIVAPADADALAAAIAALDDDRQLLASMSSAARRKAATFSLASYAQQVDDEVLRRRPSLRQ